jgi:aspartate--ammonia ligase
MNRPSPLAQLLAACLLAWPAAAAAQSTQAWAARYDGPAHGADLARRMAVDAAGNVHVTGQHVQELFPGLRRGGYPDFPKEIKFLHAEELLDMYPDLPRKQRETAILQKHPAVFIIGIGWTLEDGYPHELRAAADDDWVTETRSADGHPRHGLNGDSLVWNPVTKRRHELSSMGIRVTRDTLRVQLRATGQEDFLKLPYHQAILDDRIPLSIGGGIGQARTFMYLLRTAHLGEVTVSVWPRQLKEICARRNSHVLE